MKYSKNKSTRILFSNAIALDTFYSALIFESKNWNFFLKKNARFNQRREAVVSDEKVALQVLALHRWPATYIYPKTWDRT